MSLVLTGDDLTVVSDLPADQVMMAAQVGEALFRAYPGHLWFVSFDGGVIVVRHGTLSSKWGFKINTTKSIASSSELEDTARRLGGELLERFRIGRGPSGASEARESHILGLLTPDL